MKKIATFGERLQEALDLRNIKPTELSKKTGIGKSSISEWLSGNYEAKQDKVYQIAKELQVNEAWLMGLDVPLEKYEDLQGKIEKLNRVNRGIVVTLVNDLLTEQEENIQYYLNDIEVPANLVKNDKIDVPLDFYSDNGINTSVAHFVVAYAQNNVMHADGMMDIDNMTDERLIEEANKLLQIEEFVDHLENAKLTRTKSIENSED